MSTNSARTNWLRFLNRSSSLTTLCLWTKPTLVELQLETRCLCWTMTLSACMCTTCSPETLRLLLFNTNLLITFTPSPEKEITTCFRIISRSFSLDKMPKCLWLAVEISRSQLLSLMFNADDYWSKETNTSSSLEKTWSDLDMATQRALSGIDLLWWQQVDLTPKKQQLSCSMSVATSGAIFQIWLWSVTTTPHVRSKASRCLCFVESTTKHEATLMISSNSTSLWFRQIWSTHGKSIRSAARPSLRISRRDKV